MKKKQPVARKAAAKPSPSTSQLALLEGLRKDTHQLIEDVKKLRKDEFFDNRFKERLMLITGEFLKKPQETEEFVAFVRNTIRQDGESLQNIVRDLITNPPIDRPEPVKIGTTSFFQKLKRRFF